MDVIIGGYNLMVGEQGLGGALERRRNGLIQRLSRYQKARGFAVIVVFDGWISGGVSEAVSKTDGITVIYSRQGEKADNVVVRVAHEKGSGCVVVSSDREVRKGVERFGAAAIYASEFNQVLRALDEPGEAEAEEFEGPFSLERGIKRTSRVERRREEKLRKLRLG